MKQLLIILSLLITFAATAQVDQATSSVFTQGDLSQRVGTKDGVQMKVGGLATIGDGGGGTFRWDANSTATPVPGKVVQPVISGVPQTAGRWILVLQAQESVNGLGDSLAAIRKSITTYLAGSGNALISTIATNGTSKVISIYTGSNTVGGVQVTSKNGSGMQYWRTTGDTTYMFYGDAPDSLITYSISIVGKIDTAGIINVGGGNGGGGNNGGGGSGGNTTNSLWTFRTDTTCQVNYGAQYSTGNASTNMVALANESMGYARVSYNGSGAATYTPYTAGGYNVLLSYNPAAPVSGNYTALPTDSLVFRNNIKNLISTNGTTNVMGAAIINEWSNIQHGKGFWNPTSAKNTINLLRSGANALHELGLKAYDGGFAGDILYYEVWKDYNSRGYTDSAAAFALAAFPTGTNLTTWATDTAHGYRITFLDSVIAALPTLPLDGVNVHFYATVLDTDSSNTSINTLAFKQIVRYLHRVSGKPVITNEFGTNNNTNPDIMSQLIDAIQELHDAKNGDMSFAFWNGADVNHAIANSDGSLTTYGMALRNKITETRVDVTGGQQ